MSGFYVTTPIYYVNDLPHIGHIYTTVVADTVARYRRMTGDRVLFLTGTDEHGQKIERAAEERGLAPIALADRVVTRYHELWDELAISHDDFIRTTEDRHRRGVEEMIRRIDVAGDLYVDRHQGWYCTSCEAFYTEKELVGERLCPDHERPVEWHDEENVFFRLSRYEEPLLRLYEERPGFVRPESRLNEVRSFVESGLRDLSVSRTGVDWGIPFPGHEGHTVYVWLEALTNYVSALGFGGEETGRYDLFWHGDDVQRVHLIGKDILRFHAVYWPAFLLSAGMPLPDCVHTHGWWVRDERKVSKSTGNIVRPDHLIERFGSDALRLYLLRDMVFGQDASFSDEAFVERYNADLANGLGNTISRLVTLSRRHFEGRWPPRAERADLEEVTSETLAAYRETMDARAFQRALERLWSLLAEVNQYLVEHEPWKLVEEEGGQERAGEVVWNGLEATRIVATALLPVMPRKAEEALAVLGVEEPPDTFGALEWGGLGGSATLPEPDTLFPRIDKDEYLGRSPATSRETAPTGSPETREDEREERKMISFDDFMKTELKVGRVIAADEIEGADKLLRLTVDVGGDERTMVAGIKGYYDPEELVGRQVVVVANLEPATIMGVESEGMVLAATEDGVPVLIEPEREVEIGVRVR